MTRVEAAIFISFFSSPVWVPVLVIGIMLYLGWQFIRPQPRTP